LLSGDGFYRVENVPKSISAGASPGTPLGELTALPRPLADGERTRCPSQITPSRLDHSGLAASNPKHIRK